MYVSPALSEQPKAVSKGFLKDVVLETCHKLSTTVAPLDIG